MNLSPEQLCMKLLKSDSEKDVIKILQEENLWDDESVWHPFGDNENNYSAIGNQQGNSVSALVEKLVNSIDAVLMRECLIRGMDPTDSKAPKNIEQALETYFKIPSGNLANVLSKQRSELAQNIGLVATGSKRKSGDSPCLTIYDLGEGQTPNRMPDTLLSLSKSNKLKIPFVQGKFNMGGTGVLPFCGKENLQLIISKRHPQIQEKNDPTVTQWGFTLVRRQEPRYGRRSSMYTYLMPNKKILSFNQSSIQLPDTEYGTQKLPALEWGTIIKLYEYELNTLGTLITNNLLRAVSLALVKPGLPIRFFEKRGYTGHSLENNMHGLNVRLEDERKDIFEPNFPIAVDLSIEGESMKATVYAFQKDKSKTYKEKQGIIFTINGQTHGYIPQRFFTRKAVNLSYIADDLLVIIDATTISSRAREDLFMNSRDRLREGQLYDAIEKNLAQELKDHQGLRALQERRRRENLQEQLEDEKPLQEVLQKIFKKSPSLTSLFLTGTELSNPYKPIEAVQQEKNYEGKQHPTFFTIMKKDQNRKAEINRRVRVQFETDVVNDYFSRDRDQGQHAFWMNGQKVPTYTINLLNGIATLNITLPTNAQVEDVFAYQLDVIDSTLFEPFINQFNVTVAPAIDHENSKVGTRKPPTKDGKGDRQQPSMLAMPHVEEVRQNRWEEYGFDKYSALKVVRGTENTFDFFINMDNIYLGTELKSKRKGMNPKVTESQYKYAFVLIGLAILDGHEKDNSEIQEQEDIVEEQITKISRSLAPVIIPIIESLGNLSDEDIADE